LLNPLISVAAMIAATALFGAIFGRWTYGIFPGIIVGVVVLVLLGRRVMKDVEARMQKVQALLATQERSPAKMKARVNEAIGVLKGAMKWDRWQPLVAGQLAGQIGQLYFMSERTDEAEPYLVKSSSRNWMAKAMLATIQFRRRDHDAMKANFEAAAKHSKKESLLWNMYAWCMWKQDNIDDAIAILNRAMEHVASDERTQRNLNALKNGKKMKMKGWDMMWYQFRLEKMPQPVHPMQSRQKGNKAMYRGR
jgi:tetratricopeptide (TPR) repeat protein